MFKLCNCHNPRGICLITRRRLGLSHLREHKFKHGFQDTLNPLCSCGNDVESTKYFLLHSTQFANERRTLQIENTSNVLRHTLLFGTTLLLVQAITPKFLMLHLNLSY